MYNIELMKKELRKNLSEYRCNHSYNVANVALELAKHYQCDEEKAYVAGLLHDIAKEYSDEENIKIVKKYNISPIVLEEDYKKILHADIGAIIAKEKYQIDDEIYHAIKYHTFGTVPMNLLDKIVYVADKIEPGKNYDGIEEERALAYKSIDLAVILCIENNFKKLEEKGKKPYKGSGKVLKYLKKEVDKNDKNI